MNRPTCDMGICTRKAFRGFYATDLASPIALCRKHEARMQETRKADLAERGIDPITYSGKASAAEIYAWTRGNRPADEAYSARLGFAS